MKNDIVQPLYNRHSDDVQEIITSIPRWTLRWGTTVFVIIIMLIICVLQLIKYPDIVKARFKVVSENGVKPVTTKIPGKLVKLFVTENQMVNAQQVLGFMESTADHQTVIALLAHLKEVRSRMARQEKFTDLNLNGDLPNLGELQVSYQGFIESLLNYKSITENGFLVQNKKYLENDIHTIHLQEKELDQKRRLVEKELLIAEEDYKMHKKLVEEQVETAAEFREQESRYLAKKEPLINAKTAIIEARRKVFEKTNELNKQDDNIRTERINFLQSLNSMITHTEEWIAKYVIFAPQAGKVIFSSILEINQILPVGQTVFFINPVSHRYFGEVLVPQLNIGKVKKGQPVLIKLKSFPFEDFGAVKGQVYYLSDLPVNDSVFLCKVLIKPMNRKLSKPIILKQGMLGEAEIITEDATVLSRILMSLTRSLPH